MTVKNSTPLIWVLLDPAIGHANQALAVVEALDEEFVAISLEYNKDDMPHNFLVGRSIKYLTKNTAKYLIAPWPDIIITAGRRTTPVARWVKKQNKNTKIVQLMWPGFPTSDIDLMIVPEHDDLPFYAPKKRIMRTLLTPSRLNNKRLNDAADMWRSTLGKLSNPISALIIGGDTKYGPMTPNMVEASLRHIFHNNNGALLITTSRRTNDEIVAMIQEMIKKHKDRRIIHFFDPRKESANPYLAFLALAKKIYVTSDSISMISESLQTGKDIQLLDVDKILSEKHKRFIAHVKTLNKTLTKNPADEIADEVRKRFF